MKNSQKHWRASLLVKLSIVMALLLICLEMNWPRTQTSVAAFMGPHVSSVSTTDIVEETVTLPPPSSGIKTWNSNSSWRECSDFTVIGKDEGPPPGEILVGYHDHWEDHGFFSPKCSVLWTDIHRGP